MTDGADGAEPLAGAAVRRITVESHPCVQQGDGEAKGRGGAAGLQPEHLAVDFVFEARGWAG